MTNQESPQPGGSKDAVYGKLNELQIAYQVVEHHPVFTVEEILEVDFPPRTHIAKNLFLRDAKGRRHFLLTAHVEQPINLKALEKTLNCTKLSFASEERLDRYLGLTKGSVTPFGLFNDTQHLVEFYIDENLSRCEFVGVHPNDNTATVLIRFPDLIRVLEKNGHKSNIVQIQQL